MKRRPCDSCCCPPAVGQSLALSNPKQPICAPSSMKLSALPPQERKGRISDAEDGGSLAQKNREGYF